MDWTEEGIVLSVRRHGEASAIVTLLTREHGRHAGLVRGGASRQRRGVLQAGNLVIATWRARLEEHLGSLTVELAESCAARLLDRPGRLAALMAATALVEVGLPEREPHPALFESLKELLPALDRDGWAEAYVRWELQLVAELGFGLDLSRCAATGRNDELAYVSPKTGRAVSLSAGEPYRDRLLPLPVFLTGAGAAEPNAIVEGLRLTGHFLNHHVLEPRQRGLPDARERLVDRLRRGLD